MRGSRRLPLALVGLAACATLGEPSSPGPSAFAGARSVALVRWSDAPGPRRVKDPLDALQESLEARGYATRVVEIGPRAPDRLRGLERLYERIGSLVLAGSASPPPGRRVARAGGEAGAEVSALGVDAVAFYHRFDAAPLPLLEPPRPGSLFAPEPLRAVRPPLGAISLVGRDGTVAWFAWGGLAAETDPTAPVNPAEAIEAALAMLGGAGDGQ